MDGEVPDVLVIDDAGNGFRDEPSRWPNWLASPPDRGVDLAILKTARPFTPSSPLMERFVQLGADCKVMVVNAYDLRDDGVDISRRLSWERTVADLAHYGTTEACKRLTADGHIHLVVRLGLEGTAILHREEVILVAEPGRIEGDRDAESGYEMSGKTSAFVAAMAVEVLKPRLGLRDIADLVETGMAVAYSYRTQGYRKAGGRLALPAEIGTVEVGDDELRCCRYRREFSGDIKPRGLVPESWKLNEGRPPVWMDVAKQIVRKGEATIADLPHARFGDLVACDWREVETLRFVANLIRKYLVGTQSVPLSLAVFGPPGSGKSYGFQQIAKSFGKNCITPALKELKFNVAQWTGPRDLIAALHRVRDEAIGGTIPLVFFDEFDSALADAPLAWLKLFLAPMQDGAFRDDAQDHAIGRAVFVFAGGTATSYEAFAAGGTFTGPAGKGEGRVNVPPADAFRAAKGPDFISRLRGAIDVRGVGPDSEGAGEEEEDADGTWLLRRALILRDQLARQFGSIFDADGAADIDDVVLDGLLGVRAFRHGTRSLEAILRMSSADAATTHLGLSDLPPDAQLRLHVDVEAFAKCVAAGKNRK